MSAKAAGAYLWELRKRKKLSRDKAADLLGTARSQIERIEYGTNETLAPIFLAFIRLVDGDHDEVTDLLLEKDAKVEDARKLAARRWDIRAREIAKQVPQENAPDTAAFLRQLRSDPDALREFRKLIADEDDAQQH